MNFHDAFNPNNGMSPRGLAGATVSPMGVEDSDLPPGAPDYAAGPLANPPPPSPTPAPQSLTSLAAGGLNHAESWMSGQPAPQRSLEQQPFNSAVEEDLPPGAPPYAGGPLANPPRPTPAPKLNTNLLKRFSFSSAFDEQGY